jgi:hypothetical protein
VQDGRVGHERMFASDSDNYSENYWDAVP